MTEKAKAREETVRKIVELLRVDDGVGYRTKVDALAAMIQARGSLESYLEGKGK